MKQFNLNQDVIYTDSFIGEHIRFLSSSILKSGPAITESSPNLKTFVHWNDTPYSGGFFQTIYDKNHRFIEAIPLMDVSFG